MGLDQPKQYVRIGGRAVIDWTLDAFRASAQLECTYVLLAVDDVEFDAVCPPRPREPIVRLHCGGPTRRDTVLNGLAAIDSRARAQDWVLVHDAARPGLTAGLIAHLIEQCRDDPVGGLLALPVADTLKRSRIAAGEDGPRVDSTLERAQLWAAQTPQMFRYDVLVRALRAAPEVTDEAGAVEALGLRPRLVRGSTRNLKLTYPDDLAMISALLATD